jgi:DNA modification methylase
MTASIVKADAIEFLRSQPADSIDLVFGSPPYEEARLYLEGGVNLGISRKTDEKSTTVR